MIDLKPDQLKKVKRILNGHVPEHEVLCYGLRAKGPVKELSYLDLAVMTLNPLVPPRLEKLAAALSGAGFPFRVETVDWAATGKEYRKVIRTTGVVIQKSRKTRE